jgi:hypothetical protein
MAGSPLKRQRKAGIRTEDGTVIRFPYMPRVADLPPGWRYFTTAEKIGHLIGLDRCREILSWGPITELDPLRLSFQMQVIRIMLRIGLKAVLDGTLDAKLPATTTGSASLKSWHDAIPVPVRGIGNWYGENRAKRRGSRRNLPNRSTV